MTCKDCKHWLRWGTGRTIGECDEVEYFEDKHLRDKIAFSMDVSCDDDSGLTATLMTGEDFGCVHFQQR